MLLKLAVLCLIESIRNDLAKYGSLIDYSGKSSSLATVDYTTSQYYATGSFYTCGPTVPLPLPQQQLHLSENVYIEMLIEEAEKLYNRITKEMVDETIIEYVSKSSTADK
jgi:hypothetical protein